MDKLDKIPNPSDIDRVIQAEIPNKSEDPELFELVKEFMMHGPWGEDNPSCPCMKKGKCSKRFPKDFTNETHFDNDGFPLYRRRNDGKSIEKGKTQLDNRYLLLVFTHIIFYYISPIFIVD